MMDWKEIRRAYMVPRGVVYLNNGSFGPAPRVVFEALVRSMKQLEANPAVFNEQFDRIQAVVKPKLAAFVGCPPEYMAVVVNLTFGMNVLARGIRGLSPGDEVLTTDQEYGAVNNIWDYAAREPGVVIRRVKHSRAAGEPRADRGAAGAGGHAAHSRDLYEPHHHQHRAGASRKADQRDGAFTRHSFLHRRRACAREW